MCEFETRGRRRVNHTIHCNYFVLLYCKYFFFCKYYLKKRANRGELFKKKGKRETLAKKVVK